MQDYPTDDRYMVLFFIFYFLLTRNDLPAVGIYRILNLGYLNLLKMHKGNEFLFHLLKKITVKNRDIDIEVMKYHEDILFIFTQTI